MFLILRIFFLTFQLLPFNNVSKFLSFSRLLRWSSFRDCLRSRILDFIALFMVDQSGSFVAVRKSACVQANEYTSLVHKPIPSRSFKSFILMLFKIIFLCASLSSASVETSLSICPIPSLTSRLVGDSMINIFNLVQFRSTVRIKGGKPR